MLPVQKFLEKEERMGEWLARYASVVDDWCRARPNPDAAYQEVCKILTEYERYRANVLGLRLHFSDSPEISFFMGELLPLVGGTAPNGELDAWILGLLDRLVIAKQILPPTSRA